MHYRTQLLLLSFLAILLTHPLDSNASAASFELSWTDNSADELGFHVERKLGTSGTFSLVATTGANVTSYTDAGLADATTYCYRINAFNGAGNSPYSPEVCGTTPASATPSPQVTLAVNVIKNSSANGTVTSNPAGINCGSTCSASFNSGTVVTLSATPASGSTFASWSGTGCSGGVVTMDQARTCTATFNPQVTPTPTYLLSISKSGTGSGSITSSPAGINCGSACSASFNAGTLVTLTATPASGSTFAGWSGTGCSTGKVTMDAARTCTATFNTQPAVTKFTLTVSKAGTGSGTVTSNPAGINCGGTCAALFDNSTRITLQATPAAGSIFTGWSGSGCSGGAVTVDASKSCTATFQSTTVQLVTKLGVFRAEGGQWYLDLNGNGQWDGCAVDKCIGSFGHAGDLPVTGNWSAEEVTNIGTFSPATGSWRLDTNGDGILDCAVDTCGDAFGQTGDFPVTRELRQENRSMVGIFTPQKITEDGKKRKNVKRGRWNFDVNGNSSLDGCEVDECTTFRAVGELPVVGDWNGTGNQEIGVFLPRKGSWHLDRNGNGKWDGCGKDKCLGRFGEEGDLPVVGDWDGTGKDRIGVFRPSSGMWYLDLNGNGKMDKCTVDACVGPFGQPGDLPVAGKW